ncbi:MAG: T9SS type A sorting domain-containing protein [Bacteroidales bacterium]|nr:T9SS type A sorting domain-containing protein [Bacteroidales bacterium]
MRIRKFLPVALISLLFSLPQSLSAQTGAFTFSLPAEATTSAGVYKMDCTLVRTLWSVVKYSAGSHTEYWDGKDDYGVNITAPDANYRIKVLSNNVNYTWQGTLGNSSDSMTGSSKHRGYYMCMTGLAFATNGYGYFCKGYSEGHSSIAKFSISQPQAKTTIFTGRVLTLNTDFVATDNTNVYWAGIDAYSTNNTMVHATKTSDDSEVIFANGVVYNNTYGKTYSSVISKLNQANSNITGLAVQKTGNKLFVSRASLNQLQVLDKTTGALLQTLTYTTPKTIAVDGSDNLWMVSGTNTVAKYTVNGNGTLTAATLTLSGLLDPLAVQVTYDGTLVSVADGSTSQQVKFFNNTTGAYVKTIGDAGGYATDATVNNSKLYFNDVTGNKPVFIAYQSDNSVWINDPGNSRVQHYNSSGTFIDRIMSLGSSYSTYVDRNDITRVFNAYMEFHMDYSVQTLTGSTGWTLVKNWGANIGSSYDGFQKFHFPTTLSNGRTYTFLRVLSNNNYELVELVEGGTARHTGIIRTDAPSLAPDGSLIVNSGGGAGNTESLTKYALTGFDGLNNPQWSGIPTLIVTTPVLTNKDPQYLYAISPTKVFFFNSGTFINGSTAPCYDGYHLGGMAIGGNDWIWKTEQATHQNYAGPYPGAGYFDIGNTVNQYAGSWVNAVDRNVITGYHGEFWKQSQTNKYNHYLDNGLAIGQFGITVPETTGESPAGLAGNALSPMAVKDVNGDLYLYHGDESFHAGVHRWKITNLNTIAEQNIVIPYPSGYVAPVLCYVDLMAGLPFDNVLTDGTAGWNRTPTAESSGWSVKTSVLKYDKLTSPDIFVNYSQTSGGQYSVTRDLGNNNVSNSWALSGEISYQGNMPNNNIEQYFDILDNTGKVLTHFYVEINFSGFIVTVHANDKIIIQGPETPVRWDTEKLQPFSISVSNGVITFNYSNYAPVTASVFDPTANWKTPKTLKLYFVPGSPAYGKNIGLKDFKFFIDVDPQCEFPTVIAEKNTSNYFVIYPNPADNRVTINYQLSENTPIRISVHDLIGKEVMQFTIKNNNAGENQFDMNTGNLLPGIYFVTLETKNGLSTQKLIINH